MALSKNGQKAYESALRMHSATFEAGLPGKRPQPEDFAHITDAEDTDNRHLIGWGHMQEPEPLNAAAVGVRDRMLEDARTSQGPHFDIKPNGRD